MKLTKYDRLKFWMKSKPILCSFNTSIYRKYRTTGKSSQIIRNLKKNYLNFFRPYQILSKFLSKSNFSSSRFKVDNKTSFFSYHIQNDLIFQLLTFMTGNNISSWYSKIVKGNIIFGTFLPKKSIILGLGKGSNVKSP